MRNAHDEEARKEQVKAKSKEKDWSVVGHFIALFVKLYTIVTDEFKEAKVGVEALEWIVGPGRDLCAEKVREILTAFLKANPPEAPKLAEAPKVLEAYIELGGNPGLPFETALVEKHNGGGRVKIEKRADGLYLGGKKVIFKWVSRQLNGKCLTGIELRLELTGQLVLNACVLDFLLDHTEFIPDDWKVDEAGNTIYIFFWGTIYRDPADDSLCVRCLCWRDGRWRGDCRWLGIGWGSRCPAAVLASQN